MITLETLLARATMLATEDCYSAYHKCPMAWCRHHDHDGRVWKERAEAVDRCFGCSSEEGCPGTHERCWRVWFVESPDWWWTGKGEYTQDLFDWMEVRRGR